MEIDKKKLKSEFEYALRNGDKGILENAMITAILRGWYYLGSKFAVEVKKNGIETSISDFALSVYYSIRLNFEKALKYAKDNPYSLRFLFEIKGENEKAYEYFKRIKDMPSFHKKLREFMYMIYKGKIPDFDIPDDKENIRQNLKLMAYGYKYFMEGELHKALDILHKALWDSLENEYDHNAIIIIRLLIPIARKYLGDDAAYTYLNTASTISNSNRNKWAWEMFWIFSRYMERHINEGVFEKKLNYYIDKGSIIHMILLMGLKFEDFEDEIMNLVKKHWQYHTLRIVEMLK